MYRSGNPLFRSHKLLGITSFGVEIHAQTSGFHSQKSDSNHYFGVDSTFLEWIFTPLHEESNNFHLKESGRCLRQTKKIKENLVFISETFTISFSS